MQSSLFQDGLDLTSESNTKMSEFFLTKFVLRVFLQRVSRGKEEIPKTYDDDDVVVYDVIHDQTNLPPSWSKFLKVRQNKQLLCRYLSNKFIEIVPSILTEDQIFVTSGGFKLDRPGSDEWTGKYVTKADVQQHTIFHNHEETDTQIWLHVANTKCSVVHIYSVDRDD